MLMLHRGRNVVKVKTPQRRSQRLLQYRGDNALHRLEKDDFARVAPFYETPALALAPELEEAVSEPAHLGLSVEGSTAVAHEGVRILPRPAIGVIARVRLQDVIHNRLQPKPTAAGHLVSEWQGAYRGSISSQIRSENKRASKESSGSLYKPR